MPGHLDFAYDAPHRYPVVPDPLLGDIDAICVGLGVVAIGGGARGVNVHLAPADLVAATGPEVGDITVAEGPSGG